MMSLPALINASAEYRLACCDIELLTIKGRKSNILEASFTNGTLFLVCIRVIPCRLMINACYLAVAK